jgi:hypothetical protein
MGRHYGELGKPRKRDEDTFGWFGNTIRVGSRVSELALVDFLEQADHVEDTESPEGKRASMQLLRDFLHGLVHRDDWDVFWHAALDNGQTVQDLMDLLVTLTEGATGRPTRRRSASSAGRRGTGGKSKADSSLAVIRRLEREGRPDKALAVVRAQEARRAS